MERLSRIARRLDASPLADWLALVAVILFVFGIAGLLDGVVHGVVHGAVNGAVDGLGGLVQAGRNGQ